MILFVEVVCPTCNGSGWTCDHIGCEMREECKACRGTGKVNK